jgi:hypothetical protein
MSARRPFSFDGNYQDIAVLDTPQISAPEAPAAVPPGAKRILLTQDKAGIYEIKKGLYLDLLEPKGEKKNTHFRGSLPHSNGIEESFPTGPVFCIFAEDSHVDVQSGITFIKRRFLRESVVANPLVDRYPPRSDEDFVNAERLGAHRVVLPLATQRINNYCRWWLDSISKIFIAGQSTALQSNLRSRALEIMIPPLPTSYQRQTQTLFAGRPAFNVIEGNGLLRGSSVTTSGLTYGGGQRIGALVKDYVKFLDHMIPRKDMPARERQGQLLYLSRGDADMRKIVNEAELVPLLKNLGFTILHASKLPLVDQIEAFRQAKVVLSAHGAGLTNILFCRPGTTLIEIFPEGGVHGSAFTRLSSHLDFNYYFATGQRVENRHSAKNKINADIVVDTASFIPFVRDIVI